jgi:hypothetical protein
MKIKRLSIKKEIKGLETKKSIMKRRTLKNVKN